MTTEAVRMIEAGAAPERFARGWHCLGLARDLGDGKPHGLHAFGTKLVVWRGSNGEINVLDAYCRHMGGDLSQGVPQDVHMVKADRGNHRDQRLGDVGGVQAPAYADFQYGVPHPLALKIEQSQTGGNFIGNKGVELSLAVNLLNLLSHLWHKI